VRLLLRLSTQSRHLRVTPQRKSVRHRAAPVLYPYVVTGTAYEPSNSLALDLRGAADG
jgi:hypothetical protein